MFNESSDIAVVLRVQVVFANICRPLNLHDLLRPVSVLHALLADYLSKDAAHKSILFDVASRDHTLPSRRTPEDQARRLRRWDELILVVIDDVGGLVGINVCGHFDWGLQPRNHVLRQINGVVHPSTLKWGVVELLHPPLRDRK